MPKGLQVNAVEQLQTWQILQGSQVRVAQCATLTQTKASEVPEDPSEGTKLCCWC